MSFKTRYFNKIEYFDGIHALKKTSYNIDKIKAEYDYYYELPPHLQRYFAQPFHFEIDNDVASYYTEKYNISDLAKQFVSNDLSAESFSNFIQKIKRFQWESGSKELSKEDMYIESKSIVIDKSIERSFILESNKAWKESEYKYLLSVNGITTDSLLNRIAKAFNDNMVNRKSNLLKVSHGDLCFSNILWDNDRNIMRLIDPKGLPYMFIDEYYDIAKLSHSLLGRYDEIVYGMYEVDFESKKINFTNKVNDELNEIFLSYVAEKGIDYHLLRVFEASLFLSMCPAHIEDDKRVAVFLLNCDRILIELGY